MPPAICWTEPLGARLKGSTWKRLAEPMVIVCLAWVGQMGGKAGSNRVVSNARAAGSAARLSKSGLRWNRMGQAAMAMPVKALGGSAKSPRAGPCAGSWRARGWLTQSVPWTRLGGLAFTLLSALDVGQPSSHCAWHVQAMALTLGGGGPKMLLPYTTARNATRDQRPIEPTLPEDFVDRR